MTEDRDLTDEESIELSKTTGKSRQRSNRFEVSDGRHGIWIDDDEFSYDAAIRITGDFETPEAKRAYLQAICDVLNGQEDRIPWRNDGNTDPFIKMTEADGDCNACEGSGESAVNFPDGTEASTKTPPCAMCGGSGVKSE